MSVEEIIAQQQLELILNGLALFALAMVGLVFGALRWLRVAQREHYIAPWTTRIALLWLTVRPVNIALAVVIFGLSITSFAPGLIWLAYPAIVLSWFFPWGLSPRGSSAKLAWTKRLNRLALTLVIVTFVILVALLILLGPAAGAIVVVTFPLITDLALVILKPIEKALSRKFLVSARKRLQQVRPTVVAITGSYGKTSTKGYIAHLVGGAFSTVASPASFNNLMGLSRAVNEHVVPGTEVFVAEMGVYGTGEIRELSESFPPDIAAITTIGEAHLARMGSREVIFHAKSEITEKAKTVVLPIDEVELRQLAAVCEAQGKRVVRVSVVPGTAADVVVDAAAGTVTVGEHSAPVTIPGVGHAVNLAVAVGIAVALDLELPTIAKRLDVLPDSRHRAEIQEAPSGVLIIDDTYNANPVGAERAVQGAAALAAERGGPLVVVTPGMVELGSVQFARNAAFATSIAQLDGYLFAIARTNRAALLDGSKGGPHEVRVFDKRAGAVAAALDQAGERGVILYENDLPDHYP
jgi:UDP-N-acetylmuramoyl-tripeptide--D-alanyl-D-alanine ligase